jgi:hypothetical protein
MAEPWRISEDVYQKVPGLIIITRILEIGAPQIVQIWKGGAALDISIQRTRHITARPLNSIVIY